MQVLSGKEVSSFVKDRVKGQVLKLKEQGLQPGLAVVIIGDDPASHVYVNSKVKTCEELGIYSIKEQLPSETSQEEVLKVVRELNNNPKIHGILVQSPPPKHIDERTIIETISPEKDVDCFHPQNVGNMLIGDEDGFVPCTPAGVIEILKYYQLKTAGKHAVVLGRSNIVGKPMVALLARRGDYADCTVTICHSRTQNLEEITKQADVLIAAIGKPEFVTADMVKDGAVVVDVGINRIDAPEKKRGFRLVGDVAYEEVASKASAITPVPGGVGPMTIAMLMQNTITACCQQNNTEIPEG
ncbi:MAG: bifunctional methylenetetrahydrofolate dehydrogenase/methenyltetrahydrofolate cyclohydrolase FolD [Lentisphaeria bacterium]|nr:bifunctional methylenetetrahydrofolate dehydrogenase/methenyltetrahydrofolate cyclohydrolase FolD [Lentisphaeria bacterium]